MDPEYVELYRALFDYPGRYKTVEGKLWWLMGSGKWRVSSYNCMIQQEDK